MCSSNSHEENPELPEGAHDEGAGRRLAASLQRRTARGKRVAPGETRPKPRRTLVLAVGLVVAIGIVAALGYWAAAARLGSKVDLAGERLRAIGAALQAYAIDRDFVLPPELTPWLTAPVPYLDAIPEDPFASGENRMFQYHAPSGGGWVLSSPGPDGLRDLEASRDYDPLESPDSEDLVLRAYDPTNGRRSSGDLFRVYTGEWEGGGASAKDPGTPGPPGDRAADLPTGPRE